MKTILSVLATLLLFAIDLHAQVDKIYVYENGNERSIDVYVDTVKLKKVKIDAMSEKLILTPMEMKRLAGHCTTISVDTIDNGNGNQRVITKVKLDVVLGQTSVQGVIGEVYVDYPSLKFADEPVFGMKALDLSGLTYTLTGNQLTIQGSGQAASGTGSYVGSAKVGNAFSSMCPQADAKGAWFAGAGYVDNETRLIACSTDSDILAARKAILDGLEEYVGGVTSVEQKVPPPQAVVDGFQKGITVRFFNDNTEEEASFLQTFLSAMCNNVNVVIEDMRPRYQPNSYPDYLEIWIK